MREPLSESPFRDVSAGRSWQYVEGLENPPGTRDRSWLVTVLGFGMLLFAAVSALPAIKLAPLALFTLTLGSSSDMYRDLLLPSVIALVLVLLPGGLSAIMGAGLLRMAPWARPGSIGLLPVLLPLSAVVAGGYIWTQVCMAAQSVVPFTDSRIIGSLGWYALLMVPFTAAMLYGLTRPQVREDLAAETE